MLWPILIYFQTKILSLFLSVVVSDSGRQSNFTNAMSQMETIFKLLFCNFGNVWIFGSALNFCESHRLCKHEQRCLTPTHVFKNGNPFSIREVFGFLGSVSEREPRDLQRNTIKKFILESQ